MGSAYAVAGLSAGLVKGGSLLRAEQAARLTYAALKPQPVSSVWFTHGIQLR